jgi:NAD(P)H-hydrate repair Nnr-like enzyme with NAD(P)H-hydrate epimerase domain
MCGEGGYLFSSFLIFIKRQDCSLVILHVADICWWKYELRNSFVITVIQRYNDKEWGTVSLCVRKLLVVDCVFGTGIH